MTDPVRHCIVHKTEGCAHVDGYLCDMETCSILRKVLLDNIRAGAERNTDDHCGYSEGTREAYEEFVKKRNYKIGND